MKYLVFTFIHFFVITETFSQKCDRPDEVFLELKHIDESSIFNESEREERLIYLEDSTEVFILESEITQMSKSEYSEITIDNISSLKNEARRIRRCEIKRGGSTIYIDIDINSIFEKIFIIYKINDNIFRVRAHWVDGIE